jgi:hypothetical protein
MHELTETEAKQQGDPPKSARYWHNQIDAALGREKNWRKKADAVVARYMDERPIDNDVETRRINILWSNTEVLKSVLFAELGQPDVRRLFPAAGRATKVARTAALVMERSMVVCANHYDLDAELEDGIEDYLTRGRGQMWLEYSAEIVPDIDPATKEQRIDPATGEPLDKVGYQSAELVHVCDTDWTHGPGKRWRQVPWVARMHLFTKDDFTGQFPDIDPDKLKIPFNFTLAEGKDRTDEQGAADFKRAKVWEIWDKVSKSRIYIADGYDWEIERTEDPYRLEGFFPCPPPLLSIKKTDNLVPQPEFCQYQDQAAELDRINQRLYTLVEALKYCGVYDASGDDETLAKLGDCEDGEFLPYKNMKALAQGGGLAAAFQVRDLAPIAAAVQTLAQRAVSLIQSIYEITGISDVIRGSTDPNETLGAQQLKAKFGSTRMQKRQKTVQRWVRNAHRLKAEIIAEHFERDNIVAMTGILLPTAEEIAKAQQTMALVQQHQKMQAMQQMAQQGAPQAQGMAA